MVRGNLAPRMIRALAVVSCIAALLCAAAVSRAIEPNVSLTPMPLGAVVQDIPFFPAGETPSGSWRAVTSKKMVAQDTKGNTFFQWYLSIYQIDPASGVYQLRAQSPGDGPDLLATVTQGHGTSLYFPNQLLNIVGAAQLMPTTGEQLVVQTHEEAADCGSTRVDVLGYDAKTQKLATLVHVENGCSLKAQIVKTKGVDEIALAGPYYGPKAALCCPTKTSVQSMLHYESGTWVEDPLYFKLTTPAPPSSPSPSPTH